VSLVVRDITCTYPSGKRSLDGVSLEDARGIFGLRGPNGAGKSTLTRIVATLQRADSGTVIVDGHDLAADPMRVRASLGYLPQDFGFHPNVPVEETLAHFATLKEDVQATERRAVVERLMQRVNLWPERRRVAGALSGGMRQRLGVAIALCGSPRLLVLDEPTAGLDPAERHRLYDVLAACGEEGVVLLSTHLVEDVHALCPSKAIIDRGRVVARGTPRELVAPLRGRLWHRAVAPGDTTPGGKGGRCIPVRRRGGQPVAHIVADDAPDDTSVAAEPTLEDAYFSHVTR
jgi:ABC-type multidrug transport system ATPase subunit